MSNLEGLLSVKNFGAFGDGVSDDTAAIEATIKAMKAGSCLYFPGGTYVISTGLSDFRSVARSIAAKGPG